MPPDDPTPETPPDDSTPETPSPTPSSRTFTQDQVNSLLADEKRRGQKTNERIIKQLEDLKKSHPFSVEEKERLETQIENLKTEYMTKEELAKREADKLRKDAKKQADDLAKDRDVWKDRFTNDKIERDIYDAAAPDAYNAMQIVLQLRPNTRLVEELNEDNQPTGRLVTRVRLAGRDKDGNTVMLDLSPSEAIKQMKEMEEHNNLFKSGAHSGVGGTNASGVLPKNGPPVDDTAAYRAWRKAAGLSRKT